LDRAVFSGNGVASRLCADFDLQPHSSPEDAPPGAGIVVGNVIPYLPEALEQKKKSFAARVKDDPRLKCRTLGTPRGIYYPEPFQIFQRGEDLTVVFEFGHSVRTIHTPTGRACVPIPCCM
jgi:hypothetical protein